MSDRSSYAQPFDEVFTLEADGPDAFVAQFPFAWGGPTLACAVRVACLTVADKTLRSLHAWFLRPVEADTPVRVAVERVRDGRLLAHRRVQLTVDGRLLFELTASFGAQDAGGPDGIAWQERFPDAAIPPPEQVASQFDEWAAQDLGAIREPLEWRLIGAPYAHGAGGGDSAWDAWVRPAAPLPAAAGWDGAALAYLSDNHSDWSMAQRVKDYTIRRYSSLDTAMWFHAPPRWDDWTLIRSVSEVARGGFALGRRALYRRDGALIATMQQEALYRQEGG